MTQAVNVPGVGTLNFPDGMSQADMAAAIQKNFPQIHPKTDPDAGSRLLGGAEGDVNAFTSGVNAIPQGLAGIVGAIKGAVTPGDSADNASQRFMQAMPKIPQFNPTDQRTREGLQATQDTLGAIAGAPQALLSKGVDLRRQAIQASPLAQTQADAASSDATRKLITDLAGGIAPMAFGPKGKPGIASTEVTPFKLANSAGYRIMPSEAAIKGGTAPVGKLVEGLAGSAKTGVDATVKNQAVTNRLASQELGAPKGAMLTPETLDALRKPHNAVYDEVAKLSDLSYKGPMGQPIKVGKITADAQYYKDLNDIGRTPGNSFPDAKTPGIDELRQQYAVKDFNSADAVLQIRNLRKNAQANYKASSMNMAADSPMLAEKADAQMGIANALEGQLDRAATNLPGKLSDPTLIPRWKAARQGLAKINTVDNAIKAGTTDVSAPALAKQLNKGAPLSGHLKTIADTANAFPISVRDITAVRNKVPINALEGFMGTGGVVGQLAFGEPHAALVGLSAMLARPAARSALLSKPIQGGMLPHALSPEMLKLLGGTELTALLQGNKP